MKSMVNELVMVIGASLSETHTSVTSLRTRVCIYRMPLCTEKQVHATVYILTPNTHICIREASSQKLGRAWEVGTMPNTGKCILGNRLSLVVHNGGI